MLPCSGGRPLEGGGPAPPGGRGAAGGWWTVPEPARRRSDASGHPPPAGRAGGQGVRTGTDHAHLDDRRDRCGGGHGPCRPGRVGRTWGLREVRGAASRGRRARGPTRRPAPGHDARGIQDGGRGGPGDRRGGRLRPLVRRTCDGAGTHRRRRLHPAGGGGRDSPVELPGGHTGRRDAGCAGCRQRRGVQAGSRDAPLRRDRGRGLLGRRRPGRRAEVRPYPRRRGRPSAGDHCRWCDPDGLA